MKKLSRRNIYLTYLLFVSSILFAARQLSLVKEVGWGSIANSCIARDVEEFTLSAQLQSPFPRWQDGVIRMKPMLGLLDDIVYNFEHTPFAYHNRESSEQLYIVDSNGISTSRTLRRKCVLVSEQGRFAPTEQAMLAAVNRLMMHSDSTTKWPRLREAVASGHGFLFIHYYGDYSSCNHEHHNIVWENKSVTVPLFTCSARLHDCGHAFPFPNYEVIWSARASASEWNEYFETNNLYHPWESKIPKIVWRGRLTGNTNLTKNARWNLHQFAQQHLHTGLFDFGVVGLPPHHNNVNISLADYIDRHQFQKYMGILDIDGNSWSSRFASLLCLNSVVLKVEPEQVDYFFVNHRVTPWVHYIPVKRDLSDLFDKASYVTKNGDRVQTIVKAANEWCRTNMLEQQIAEDMLDIWDSYINMFEKNWTDTWIMAKPKIMDGYQMESLPILEENLRHSGGVSTYVSRTVCFLVVVALMCLSVCA